MDKQANGVEGDVRLESVVGIFYLGDKLVAYRVIGVYNAAFSKQQFHNASDILLSFGGQGV